jgi:hypothetical protein
MGNFFVNLIDVYFSGVWIKYAAAIIALLLIGKYCL